jgi:hypothetical protein
MLSYPVHAAPASGVGNVPGLYDSLLSRMENGRTLGEATVSSNYNPLLQHLQH